MKFNLPPSVPYKRLVWYYNRADFDKLNDLIIATDWSFLDLNTTDEASENFNTKFMELAKLCIPSNYVTIRPKDRPWYDSFIRRTSRKRDRQKSIAIRSGVPQGSVLGPLLFLTYVNDIADNLASVTRLFADDSSLAVSTSDIASVESTLNDDLNKIAEWSKRWLVTFNPNKTEVVFFTLGSEVKPSLYFDNVHLDYVDSHKHLGVTFRSDGKWHDHINNILSSASKILGSMRALKFKLKRNTLNQIYISYMRPVLEYASIVWDGCADYEKHSLEKLQYEAARIVTGLTRSVSIDRLLNEIGWVSLSDRRNIQKLVTMYKAKHRTLPDYLLNLIPDTVANDVPYLLRNRNDYITVARRTQIFKSFIPSASSLWNDLESDIRESSTIHIFKSKLKLKYKPSSVPTYFCIGERLYSVYHAQMLKSFYFFSNLVVIHFA
ncbi:uncharacterized protein LOC128548821 [Mercenaria mercenaria]|uniref:uncharacterized protein LOC128548821 n=1 Tax=Mercenaria mercenaria TaxID=6596 RepID=UPI00234F7B02|nr:uncharacterized protein LOC128548821 [Mercenaria mercenaria]